MKTARYSKFRAVPTIVDGIRFASKKEAKRYGELKIMRDAGVIDNLCLQVRYPLDVNGVNVCTYVADFVYREGDGDKLVRVVEDVKGFRTPEYKLKKKLMKAIYGIEIREI